MIIEGIVRSVGRPKYQPNKNNPGLLIAVTHMTVAVERKIHDKGGELTSAPQMYTVRTYNGLAKVTSDYCREGSHVRLEVGGILGHNDIRFVVATEVDIVENIVDGGGGIWKRLSAVAPNEPALAEG